MDYRKIYISLYYLKSFPDNSFYLESSINFFYSSSVILPIYKIYDDKKNNEK